MLKGDWCGAETDKRNSRSEIEVDRACQVRCYRLTALSGMNNEIFTHTLQNVTQLMHQLRRGQIASRSKHFSRSRLRV